MVAVIAASMACFILCCKKNNHHQFFCIYSFLLQYSSLVLTSHKKIGESRGVRLQYRVCVCVHRSYHDLLLQLGKWSHEIANGLVHAYLHSLESRRGSLWCALFRIEPACPTTTRRAFFEGCYLLDWPIARRTQHSPC